MKIVQIAYSVIKKGRKKKFPKKSTKINGINNFSYVSPSYFLQKCSDLFASTILSRAIYTISPVYHGLSHIYPTHIRLVIAIQTVSSNGRFGRLSRFKDFRSKIQRALFLRAVLYIEMCTCTVPNVAKD